MIFSWKETIPICNVHFKFCFLSPCCPSSRKLKQKHRYATLINLFLHLLPDTIGDQLDAKKEKKRKYITIAKKVKKLVFGRFFVVTMLLANNSYTVTKPVYICKDHTCVGWAAELSIWVAPMKHFPNLLCQTAYSWLKSEETDILAM